MPMKKIKIFKIILLAFVMIMIVPVELKASSIWSGTDVNYPARYDEAWGVDPEKISKVNTSNAVYSINDLSVFSAHITNAPEPVGRNVSSGFVWCNTLRLGYVKLIKVEGLDKLSCLFAKGIFLDCFQIDKDFNFLDKGTWIGSGDVCDLLPDAEWIMIIFRKWDSSHPEFPGLSTSLSYTDVNQSSCRYIILRPFTYQFDLNGGTYNGESGIYTAERMGTEKMILPVPAKEGYEFDGWKSSTGEVYNDVIEEGYDANMFKDAQFEAVWKEILPESVSIDSEYYIIERNSGESKKITANVGPENAHNKTVEWSSSDENVAKVDEYGNVTGVNTGTATITAKTVNGLTAECKVYVMGFKISVPASCTINESYAIKIDVFNNGEPQMTGRKRVIVDADSEVILYREGDEETSYNVLAESSEEYDGTFRELDSGDFLADTMESKTVFYRLKPAEEITRAGDYSGNVNFSVIVR